MSENIIGVDRKRAWAPRVTEATRPFWEALTKGVFMTTRCADCLQYTFPPKPICPHCWSKKVGWAELSRLGRLYSRTVIHAPPKVFEGQGPIHVGIVDLDEGIRICCGLIEDSPVSLDSRVEIVTLLYSDGALFAARQATPKTAH